MHVNLYKCQILNKVKLLLIHMQQDMEKKLYKIVIPREIYGDLIIIFWSAYIYIHRNNATYHINSRDKPEAYLVAWRSRTAWNSE